MDWFFPTGDSGNTANTDLFKERVLTAVSQNNLEELDKLLNNDRKDPNFKPGEYGGCKAVYIAAEKGHSQCLERLFKAGANRNTSHISNVTPLVLAERNDHIEAMEVILRNCKCKSVCGKILSNSGWQKILKQKENDSAMLTMIYAVPDLNMMAMVHPNLKAELLNTCYGHLRSLQLLFYLGFINSEDIKKESDRLLSMSPRPSSRNGSERKHTVNPFTGIDFISSVPKEPSTLQHFCKLTIRKSFHDNCNVFFGVQQLPIPESMKDTIIFITGK